MKIRAHPLHPRRLDPTKIQDAWSSKGHDLFLPINGASLAIFRILFGLVLLLEILHYFQTGWIAEYWIKPTHHFGYWPLDFLKPLPGNGMYILFGVLALCATAIMVGFCYRISTTIFFLGFTYTFLLEQARYLNHFYLVSLISFVLIFVPAHQTLSIDRLIFPRIKTREVPAWSLWWIRFMVALPYFFGGIAKLNTDWLHGEPLREWLAGHTEIPIVGPLLAYDETIMAMAYSGMLLDLLIIPALLYRKTRWIGFITIILFHLLNAQLFTIGMFPWFMIAATTIFFPPNWPITLANKFQGTHTRITIAPETSTFATNISNTTSEISKPNTSTPETSNTSATDSPEFPLLQKPFPTKKQTLILAALTLWAAIQIALPLRHFLIPGNVHWTEEGHRYAWHMKLRSKKCQGNFWAITKATGVQEEIHPESYLVDFQTRAMVTKPYLIWQFVQIVKADFQQQGQEIMLFADLQVSLNSRPYQQFTNPAIDLTAVPRPIFPPTNWIYPLEE